MRKKEKFCKHCGAPLAGNTKRCSSCNKKQSGVGKIILIVIVVIIILFIALLALPGGTSTSEPDEIVYMNEQDIPKLYSDASDYIGKYVKLTGQIFNIEESGDGYYFQINQDIENYDNNTLVQFETDSDIKLELDDIVLIDGYISGSETYETIIGTRTSAPLIVAKSVEITTYKEAVLPTLKTIEVGETIEKYGYTLTLDKIEFAEKETRCYFTLENNGKNGFYLDTYLSVITQGSSQYDFKYSDSYYYEPDDIDSLEEEIYPGIITTGYVAYNPIGTEEDFTIHLEGHDTTDYDEYTFKFDVSIPTE